MKPSLLLLLFFGCGWWSCGDDLTTEVARCAAIADSTERLAAYDALVAELAAQKPAAEGDVAPKMGKWEFEAETGEGGDRRYFLTVEAEPDPNRTGDPPLLVVGFMNGAYSIAVVCHVYLGTKEVKVATRLDRNQPVVGNWDLGEHGDMLLLLRDCRSDILAMMKAQTLQIRIMPEATGTIGLTFDIRGLSQGIRTLTEASKTGGQ